MEDEDSKVTLWFLARVAGAIGISFAKVAKLGAKGEKGDKHKMIRINHLCYVKKHQSKHFSSFSWVLEEAFRP